MVTSEIQVQVNGKLLVDPRFYNIVPKAEPDYDKKYINQFKALNCAEDLRKLYSWNNKQITQVMALWAAFKKFHRSGLKAVLFDSKIVVTNNKRMLAFLQHMTHDQEDKQENHSWKVYMAEHLPDELLDCVDYYFLINPTKALQQKISSQNNTGYLFMLGEPIFNMSLMCLVQKEDNAVCGPIKTVSVGV
jgi:hypothetical protein